MDCCTVKNAKTQLKIPAPPNIPISLPANNVTPITKIILTVNGRRVATLDANKPPRSSQVLKVNESWLIGTTLPDPDTPITSIEFDEPSIAVATVIGIGAKALVGHGNPNLLKTITKVKLRCGSKVVILDGEMRTAEMQEDTWQGSRVHGWVEQMRVLEPDSLMAKGRSESESNDSMSVASSVSDFSASII